MAIDKSQLAGNMAFLLFLGAARADATPEQAAQLRERIPPMLGYYRDSGDPEPILLAVVDVMGRAWHPTGEWASAIGRMLGRPE